MYEGSGDTSSVALASRSRSIVFCHQGLGEEGRWFWEGGGDPMLHLLLKYHEHYLISKDKRYFRGCILPFDILLLPLNGDKNNFGVESEEDGCKSPRVEREIIILPLLINSISGFYLNGGLDFNIRGGNGSDAMSGH